MGIKGVVYDVYEVCIEACRNVGRTIGTLPPFSKSDRTLSVDPCTREEIIEQEIIGDEVIEEEMPANSATDGVVSCSQSLTTRRQRLEHLRSQCSNEFEYNIKKSTEHWTEVPRKSTVDPVLLSANRKRFKRLMKHWRCPTSKYGFFMDYGKRLKMGRKIAEGGQAEIFDASFEGDHRRFVLKVFKDALLEDLERLWPPPLLPLLYVDYYPGWMWRERHCCWIRGGTVLKDGRFAFLMDKYSGDLRTLIDRQMQNKSYEQGPFQLRVAVRIMQDIAQGMKSLHRRGILHRDLKASNVLLRLSGAEYVDAEYVVADFETSMGILGTGFWRAPEVLLALKTHTFGPEIWTEKADVYSYAMTCYEVITGRIPFEDLSRNDYGFVLKGGRPTVPRWYYSDSHDGEFQNLTDGIYCWDPNPLTTRRYQVPWLDNLLERCWDSDPLRRPSFEDIVLTFSILIPFIPFPRTPPYSEGRYCNTDLDTIGYPDDSEDRYCNTDLDTIG